MKLTIILMVIALVHASGKGFSQKINLNEKNKTLVQLFKAIEQQTPYVFFYDKVDVEAAVLKVFIKNASITESLDECLKDLPLSYKIVGKNIVISRKDEQAETTKALSVLKPQLKIQGKVVDSTGRPLPGVTVRVKKTTTGVITNADGQYLVNVADDDAVLVFSAIGYITQEVAVKNRLNIHIVLQEDKRTLNNVVVVGYGTQSKAKVTGAITTVKMDEVLGDRPVSSATQLLQSAVPGLQIAVGSGKPGTAGSINLRGATSLNTNGTNTISQIGPLILVDNVPLNGGLNQLDPNEIETITVLKDAGSAAIYGARSAFGVILVTTKKGKANQKPQFNYSNNIIFANATNLPVGATPEQFLQSLKDMGTVGHWSGQNVDTWIELYNDAKANPDKYPTGLATSGTTIYPVKAGSVVDGYLGSYVPQFQNNISVSGGSDKITYRLALGAVNEKGVVVPEAKQDYYNRYNVKSFISADVSKWLTTQLDVQYFNSETATPANQPFGALVTSMPLLSIAPTITASSGITGINGIPKYIVLNGAPNIAKNNDVRVTGRGILKPVKGLTITGEYTYDKLSVDNINYDKAFRTISPFNFQDQPVGDGTYQLINGSTAYNALNIFANYSKSFGNHNFSTLVGFNKEESINQSTDVSRSGMISTEFPSLTNATGPIKAENNYIDFSLTGLFWRLNYDYKNKYLIQLNQRYDGTSKFPENHRFGLFPSASVGWLVSEEDFIKQNLKQLSSLKLRASFGEVGNQNIDPYKFIPSLTKYQPYWLNGAGSYLTSLNAPGLISSDFTWETVRTLDLGVDFGLFDNRLSGSFDWYLRDTKDILATGAVPLPAVVGADAPLQNTASLRSKGFEINVSWQDKIAENWSYHIGGNLYDFTSWITKFDGNENNLLDTYYVGQQLGEIWGYTTDRLYTVDDFVPGSLKADLTGGTLKPGVPRFQGIIPNPGDVLLKDLNGDGTVYQGLSTLGDPGDRSVIGNNTLRYQFGINGGLSYKNFDFSFVLRGVGKREYFAVGPLTAPNYGGFSTVLANTLDYWTPTNTDAFYARLYTQATGNQAHNQTTVQTRYLLNGAFLQVANLGMGYNFPKTLLNKIGINSLRVFGSVENPFMFTHLAKGLDPSVTGIASGFGYPFLRKISFGVNVIF